jgi:hypothetical protein
VWLHVLTDPLRGKTSLRRVIWLYGFGASIVYSVMGLIFVPETPLSIGVYVLFGLALGIVQSVMLWKCAYNSRFPATGKLIRVVAVAGLLTVPLVLYVLFNHPEALVPPN